MSGTGMSNTLSLIWSMIVVCSLAQAVNMSSDSDEERDMFQLRPEQQQFLMQVRSIRELSVDFAVVPKNAPPL